MLWSLLYVAHFICFKCMECAVTLQESWQWLFHWLFAPHYGQSSHPDNTAFDLPYSEMTSPNDESWPFNWNKSILNVKIGRLHRTLINIRYCYWSVIRWGSTHKNNHPNLRCQWPWLPGNYEMFEDFLS